MAISVNCFVFLIQVFPALFDWVSYPITLLIKSIYNREMATQTLQNRERPCPLRLELLASLERLLCYCHTGNTAVLATSLMDPLGLSRGVLKDGFPCLLPLFTEQPIQSAYHHDLKIDPRRWPLKDRYPAVASKKSQILSYSVEHYSVSISSFTLHYYTLLSSLHTSVRISGMFFYLFSSADTNTPISGMFSHHTSFSAVEKNASIRGVFPHLFFCRG